MAFFHFAKKDFPQDFVKRVLPKRGTDKIPNIYLNNDVDDSENCTISENIKQEDVIYDNSDVLTYLLCDEMDSKSKNNDSKKTCMVGVIHANYDKASDDIAVDDNSNMFQFSCDYLQNVYSMHINVSLNSNLLLSAGKGGIVTLFKLDDGIEESSSRDYQSKVEPRNKLLMWFKGHDRWISSARFYSIQKGSHESLNSNGSNNDVNEPNCDSNPNHRVAILTASDDGLVKIWDISKTCRASTTSMTRMHDNESDWDIGGRNSSARVNDKSDVDESQYEQTPQLLVSSACGHSKGIFAMDEKYGVIVTGSKDKSVCVSHLIDRSNVRSANVNKKSNSSTGKGCTGGYDMVTLSTFELHAGVVKSVSIKCNPNDAVSGHVNSDTSCDISYTGQSDLSAVIFASGSQDGDICIKDTRSETGDIRLQHVHSGGVHTVSWCPYTGGEYLLLSAGYDSLVKIFDIRKLSQDSVTNEPLYVVLEHVEAPGGSASRRAQSHRRSNVIQTPCFASNSVIVVPSVTSSSLSVHSVVSQSVISRCVLQHSPLSVMASPYKGGCTSTQRLVVATSTKGIMLNLSIL